MTEGNYSNVGHRGPIYKGLGAMNPCDLSIYGFGAFKLKASSYMVCRYTYYGVTDITKAVNN
jgi:hypothetical protein